MSGFMKLRVWQSDTVVTRSGETLPRSIAECDPNDPIESVQQPDDWWGEYTAPGYMDKTDPCGPYADPAEACLQTLFLYGERGEDPETMTGDEREVFDFLTVELGVPEEKAKALILC